MFKALNNLVTRRPSERPSSQPNMNPSEPSTNALMALNAMQRQRGKGQQFELVDPSRAMKSNAVELFSRNAMDFINSGSNIGGTPYSEQQLLGVYLTSVYLFAALRRVANLISRVKIVAEAKEKDTWARLPETHRLNQMFDRDAKEILPRMWYNHAIYGATAVYKLKTRRAVLQAQDGHPIYGFAEGAVAGLYVLDKPQWEIDEETMYGEIRGLHVHQYSGGSSVLSDQSYLTRKEFVYVTDWNPMSPNRGKPMVAVCIHEAVANASIAQWISEYFTRGAMPFIMVSLAEDDPALMTDADLRKYKRQFEEYWTGVQSSLRSVFFDRKVDVQQVGINAADVAAPELNETALEGISATIGLDRELIVTPSGGSQERHALLIKRAWEDTIIPLAEKYLSAIQRDMGLPDDVRLVLDVSGISELEADRDEKAQTELSIYQASMQSYNETRTRLNMPPVPEFDGWFEADGRLQPLEKIVAAGKIPATDIKDFAMELWDANLARRSEVLKLINRELPQGERDGYKYQVEGDVDMLRSMWGEDLVTRHQVLSRIGIEIPDGIDDGYRSELERGADYGEWITKLWADNLLTRRQVLQLLDMGLTLPENAPDGYSDEIGDRKTSVMDMWGNNLLTRKQALERLGIKTESEFLDGYTDEVNASLEMQASRERELIENVRSFWGDNLMTRSQVLEKLGIQMPAEFDDGYQAQIDQRQQEQSNRDGFMFDLWKDNMITRKELAQHLGVPIASDAIDGYNKEVELYTDALIPAKIEKMTGIEPPPPPGGGGGWRGLANPNENEINPMDFDDEINVSEYPYAGMEEDEDLDAAYDDDDLLLDDEDAISMSAEDDLLEGYGDYSADVLETPYGGYSDLETLPDESIPHLSEIDIVDDGMDDYDPDWEYDTELDAEDAPLYNNAIVSLSEPEPVRMTRSPIRTDDLLSEGEMKRIELDVLKEPIFDFIEALVESVTMGALDDVTDDVTTVEAPVAPSPVVSDLAADAEGDDPLKMPDAEETPSNDVYVSLWIGENEQLSVVQEHVKQVLDESGITGVTWTEPDQYHVTLVYAFNVTDGDLNTIMSLFPKTLTMPRLIVTGLSTFSNDDSTVLKLEVDVSDALGEIQSALAMAFNSHGTALSPFSDPAKYHPHITLGYAPPKVPIEPVGFNMIIEPSHVSVGRDNYVVVQDFPFTEEITIEQASARASQQTLHDELAAWERATTKKGIAKGLRFETQHLSGEDEDYIKSGLKAMTEFDAGSIKRLFNTVKHRL